MNNHTPNGEEKTKMEQKMTDGKTSQMRVWWSSRVPIESGDLETYPVESVEQAKSKLTELTNRDLADKSVTDNVGGFEVFEDGEWTEWESEDGESINEIEGGQD